MEGGGEGAASYERSFGVAESPEQCQTGINSWVQLVKGSDLNLSKPARQSETVQR